MNYDMRALVDDVAAIVRATRDDNERCERITPHLRRWMDGESPLLPEEYAQPCDGGACGHLLFTDPEGEFFVISVVFPSGTSSGVHYHGAWGVIGILQGTDEETKYARDESPADIAIGQGLRNHGRSRRSAFPRAPSRTSVHRSKAFTASALRAMRPVCRCTFLAGRRTLTLTSFATARRRRWSTSRCPQSSRTNHSSGSPMAHLTVASFNPDHLDAAAKLLASRQRALRTTQPVLPAEYEDPAACRAVVEEELQEPGSQGVVGLLGGDLVSFMIMSPLIFNPTDMVAAFMPPRPAQVHGAHAARPDAAFDAYREMYAVLAAQFVERGYFDHMVYLPALDAAAHDTFVSLGFGRALVAAVRGVEPRGPGERGSRHPRSRNRGPQGRDGAERGSACPPHSARSSGRMRSRRSRPSEANQRRHLEDPGTAHIVAYQDGRPVGLNSFILPDWIDRILRPDKTVYLYQGIVSPAARSGGIGKAILARGVEWRASRI